MLRLSIACCHNFKSRFDHINRFTIWTYGHRYWRENMAKMWICVFMMNIFDDELKVVEQWT